MPITFETQRCRVRPFEKTDVAVFMDYRNNLDWMQYQGFKGKSYLEYKAVLLQKPKFQNGVQLAVASRETGELIGDLYLKLEQNACWIGYTIVPQFAQQGLAFEVVTKLLMQLKREGLAFAKAGVEKENIASIALLKKLGFTQIDVDGSELIFQREL